MKVKDFEYCGFCAQIKFRFNLKINQLRFAELNLILNFAA